MELLSYASLHLPHGAAKARFSLDLDMRFEGSEERKPGSW